jgi:hypothetical protein
MKDYHFCKRLFFVSLVCLVTLSLCGPAMAQKFNGTWTGTWSSSIGGGSGPMSATLTQTGQALSGSMTASSMGDCQQNITFPVTGSVPDIAGWFSTSATVCQGASLIGNFTCTVSGNTLSGYYSGYVNGSPFDAGTFTATGPTEQQGNFSGTWTGYTSSYNAIPSLAETVNVTQTGLAFSGNGSVTISTPIDGCQGTFGSTVTGFISRSTVLLGGSANVCGEASSVEFVGGVTGNILYGYYVDYASHILDFGTFSVSSNCTPPTSPSSVTYYFVPAAAPLNPEFLWSRVADANLYNAQICSDSSCLSYPPNYSSIKLTTFSRINRWQVASGLNPNTNYRFYVQSIDFCGIGSWSVAIPFTTSSCGYVLSPWGNAYGPQGGAGMVTVTPSSGSCTWTATSSYPWIHITAVSSGTGNGTVSYYVDANATGIARTGSITIGGQGFMVRQPKDTFIDGDLQPVFTPYIYAIYAEGITTGYGNGYYGPSDQVTRGQMAAFIIRAIYGENSSYTMAPYFSDVPSTHNFFKYVQKMKDTGLTTVSGTYMVDDVVTRGQMAAFIIRSIYGEIFDYTPTPYFIDVPATHGFFKYVQKMKDTGITAVSGIYMVDDVVTRGQMAAFLARAFLGMQ